jgi:hypothetical protein
MVKASVLNEFIVQFMCNLCLQILWNVRSMYRAGSLMTVSRELSKYKLDLVGVQKVRREGGGTQPAVGLEVYILNLHSGGAQFEY